MVRLQFTHMTEKKLNEWLRNNPTPERVYPLVDSNGCLIFVIGYWDYEVKDK